MDRAAPLGEPRLGDAATVRAARAVLRDERRRRRVLWPFLGPAFVAAVAYVDPGNFATNTAGGARFGYVLLWVVLTANLMAMLVQMLAAKVGIATGKNLAELCRESFPRPVAIVLWLLAEAIAMATDLAEVIGAALALHLLTGVPLRLSAVAAGVAAFAILSLQRYGFRRLEAAIAGLVGAVVLSFAFQLVLARPDGAEVARHLFVPELAGGECLLLATGILGATVMPHVIYLHSALTQDRIIGRSPSERIRVYSFARLDVVIAMGIAGLVNLAMLATAAALLFGTPVDGIAGAFRGYEQEQGRGVALLFGVALLAAGLSSSSVGTLSGQVVMQGFVGWRIPVFLRRTITLAPALVVVWVGVDPGQALVLSQVVLSFGIPFALVPLVVFTSRRELMGKLANTPLTNTAAVLMVALVVGLNVYLLCDTLLSGWA